MNEEYKTTFGKYGRDKHGKVTVDDPIPPGSGWIMCGATGADGIIMWFWERIKFTVEVEKDK